LPYAACPKGEGLNARAFYELREVAGRKFISDQGVFDEGNNTIKTGCCCCVRQESLPSLSYAKTPTSTVGVFVERFIRSLQSVWLRN